jgi:hypothetical protein
LRVVGDAVDRYLVIGAFSENVPEKCSGLPVKQYSGTDLQKILSPNFKKIRCLEEDHLTSFNTLQSFTFCSFEKT